MSTLRSLARRAVGRGQSIPADTSQIVDFRSARIACHASNKLEDKLLREPEDYDLANFTALTSIVRSDAVCLDVGANIGIYSCVLSRLAAEVHAFEPVRHIRQKLQINAALNGARNLTINPFAMGDRPGELEMFQVKEGQYRGGTSTLVANNNVSDMGEAAFDREIVQVSTLDTYCAAFKRLDFVKIDVEGFELNVLRGARETLDRLSPAILFEHDQPRLGGLGLNEQDFADLLQGLGYRCFEVFLLDGVPSMAPFDWDRPLKTNNLLAIRLA